MKRIVLICQVCLACFVIILNFGSQPVSAESIYLRQAYDLVDAVNSARSANGLPAYQVNNALMASAQAHSEYQASIGSVTHTGAGGSRPVDRAIAAGYGGGAQVFITENIYGGMNSSPADAVNWWIADGGWHYEGVLSSKYLDVGAGIATAGNSVYFTLDVGYIAGQVPDQPNVPSASTDSGPSSATTISAVTPGPPKAQPVKMTTALPDGSIIHIVKQGQTLWTIAAIYNVPLKDLLELNGLSENSFVYVGNKVVIQPSYTPAPTLSETPNPTETVANPTPSPTRFSRTVTIAAPQITDNNNGHNSSATKLDPKRGIAVLIIVILAVVAVIAVSLGKKTTDPT